MEIELKKEDLLMLGDEMVLFDGCVAFNVVGISTSMVWQREILIRNVLKLFSEQYKVVELYSWPKIEGTEGRFFLTKLVTNLPWSMIEEYLDDDEFHF